MARSCLAWNVQPILERNHALYDNGMPVQTTSGPKTLRAKYSVIFLIFLRELWHLILSSEMVTVWMHILFG